MEIIFHFHANKIHFHKKDCAPSLILKVRILELGSGLLRALHVLEDLEPLFKIFYTLVCKKVPGKITPKYVENLKRCKPLEKFKHTYAPIFFSTILCFVALVYNSYFFQNSPFTQII